MTAKRRKVAPEADVEYTKDTDFSDFGTPQLREVCDGIGVEYPKTAKKSRLLKALDEYFNPPREIDALLRDITKEMGEGTIVTGATVPRFTYVDTGCFLIDLAMAGGFAENCGHMVFGEEGCSKTTLWLIVVAFLQKKYPEGDVIWVDVEKKFDPEWARKLGVDLERILVVKPRSGEHAVDIIEATARSVEVVGIFLDSIPALAPLRIIERSAEDPTVAERARLVGLMCSKLQQAWIDEGKRGHKFTFFCINQTREKIGTRFPTVSLPGGKYQQFLVDSRLKLIKKEVFESIDGKSRHTYNDHIFKFTKTKGAFSIKQGETRMVMDDYGRSDELHTGRFDDYDTVATYAKRAGLISGGGSSWNILGVTKGDVNVRFNKLEHIIQFLKASDEEFIRLKRLLIMLQRGESDIPVFPPDLYLLGWLSEDEQTNLMGLYDSLFEEVVVDE